jgi:hypothetical protein
VTRYLIGWIKEADSVAEAKALFKDDSVFQCSKCHSNKISKLSWSRVDCIKVLEKPYKRKIDIDLADDALLKFDCMIGMLRRISKLGNDEDEVLLANDLNILLTDIFHQFVSAGLEPDSAEVLK